MNITIEPEWEEFARSLVKAGHFPSLDAVVNAALSRMSEDEEEGEHWTPEWEEYVKTEVAKGVAELDRGEFATETIAELKERCRRDHEARIRKGA